MKPKLWFVIAAVCAGLALLLGLITVFSTGTGPAAYVDTHYTRASSLDLDRQDRAYTSPRPPSTVAREITDRWQPISQANDASGVYLRYSDDAVVVQPREQGSVIHVMDADRAYNRYHGVVAGFWAWTGPSGDGFRGRGPGAGK